MNETENKIRSKIKTGYYLELFGNTKSKITKDKNGQNVHDLQITEVVLIHCNTVIVINEIQESFMHCS